MRYGYFDNQNREYIIEKVDIPVSWTNYLGVRDLCTVISHNAGGYSFHKSAEHRRITRFRPNGVPLDRPGRYVYLRDDETGEYWSVSWQPVGKSLEAARYRCRHGFSYSRFECEYAGVAAEQVLFIPVDEDVELWDVRLRNTGTTRRSLSLFSYLEFSFHHIEMDNLNFQMSLYATGADYADGIIEHQLHYEPGTAYFFAADFEPDGFETVRDRFLGSYRTETNPLAVERGHCGGSVETTGNHCASLHKRIVLEPGEERRVTFMLGVGDRDRGRTVRARFARIGEVDTAFEKLRRYWQVKLDAFHCETPHEGLDTMVNAWNLYQAETCVVWSRFASFIEVGGRTGLGYRDTAQDVISVVHTNPEQVRRRLVELLRGQTTYGYGLHLFDPDWFDPDRQKNPAFKSPTIVNPPALEKLVHEPEKACSDDHLWLVSAVCEYVKETGDLAFFDEPVDFVEGESATVYEHLRRALDFSLAHVGSHGICLGLRADWNDCLNLGGGESAMVSFLLYWALQAFVEAAVHLGRDNDARRYATAAAGVREACERELWDGSWYRRGITAKGLRIGTKESAEGKVFMESNTWAVMSDAAPRERALRAMDAVNDYLSTPYGLELLSPAFRTVDDDIGFVTRVYRGVKENGAIFSHPNPWAVIAECRLGRGERAMKFYDAILPFRQNEIAEIREAEPYSYCQFVMGREHPAHGRARHPWLTGTAGWAYTAATRWILGVRLSFEGLIVDPCVPPAWKEFRVVRRWRDSVFHIEVSNPNGVSRGVASIVLDGTPITGPIQPQEAGTTHQVRVVMG